MRLFWGLSILELNFYNWGNKTIWMNLEICMSSPKITSASIDSIPYRPGQNDHFYPPAHPVLPRRFPACMPGFQPVARACSWFRSLSASRRLRPALRRRNLGASPALRKARRIARSRAKHTAQVELPSAPVPSERLRLLDERRTWPPDPGFGYDDDPD